MATENIQESDRIDGLDKHSVLEITPTTDGLRLPSLGRQLRRFSGILQGTMLAVTVIFENGQCTYQFSANEWVLEQIEPVLRDLFSGARITHHDHSETPELDEETLSGVTFDAYGARRHDWQTGLRPLVTNSDISSDPVPALTAVVDSLAKTKATVVYQALITSKEPWTYLAKGREDDLKLNRDTRAMRLVNDYVRTDWNNDKREPYAEHAERIRLIRAADSGASFEVTVRAVASGSGADWALDTLSSALRGADGRYYEVGPKTVTDPQTLYEEMAAKALPERSRTRRAWRWLIGSGVRPTFTMDKRTLGQFTLIDGARLTEEGQRTLGTTQSERTGLAHPTPEALKQYDHGFTLGTPRTANGTATEPIALPPSMQRMHLLINGKTGSGKTVLRQTGMLHNHLSTDGATINFDGKGDGAPLEYLQMHYAATGTLDDVIVFDCSKVLPALSFFDARPQIEAGVKRETAVDDIVDHYIDLVIAIMGRDRYFSAISSPDIIKMLLKAQFDEVHGSDAFTHRDLVSAAETMKGTKDAPPVSDPDLAEMVANVAAEPSNNFHKLMGGVLNRLRKIPLESSLKPMFNHIPEEDAPHFDFYDLLDEDVVIIFDTSSLRREAQRAFTIVMLSNLWAALQRRGKQAGPHPLVNVHIEEAASIATSGLMKQLLSQGRGFDVGMTLAMQFPKQLEEQDRRAYDEVLNNIGSIVTGNVNVDDDFAKLVATDEMPQEQAAHRLSALSRGEWLAMLPEEFGAESVPPFTLESLPLPPGHPAGDDPLTPASQTAFEAKRDLLEEDTREHYGLDVTTTQAPPNTEQDDAPSDVSTVSHVLEYTKRFPQGAEYDGERNAIVCTHCEARYIPSTGGLRRAIDCCYGLDRVERDDMPIGRLLLKLTAEELTATGYTVQQLYFLQAVYNAHQKRFDPEWEYDIRCDSMVRLQEYTGVEPDDIRELIDDGLLSKDCDFPVRLFTVTADGRQLLNEAHKSGIAHGDGKGDLGESSLHVALVSLGEYHLSREYVENPDSVATRVESYYDIGGGSRLDAVALDDEDTIIATFEAERINHDIAEAVPSDFDKMAEFDPEESIWLVENREAAHKILQTLNDPNDGPIRVEDTYSETTAPRDFRINTPGLTKMYTFHDVRKALLNDE